MKRIDIHSHFVPLAVLDRIKQVGEHCASPYERRDNGQIFVHTPERAYGPLGPTFFDLDLRIQHMDREGIETQVLQPPPFVFYYWSDAEEAVKLMKMQNDGTAEAAAANGRLIGFGTVMLQDVAASVKECARIKSLGLRGIEIGSNVRGESLAEEKFWPFFEVAEALGLPLLIHPHNVAGQERMSDFHLRNLIGFPLDTTLAAAQLIFSGVMDRFPSLHICLGQAGGFLPYIIGRLDAGFHARPECRQHIDTVPSEYFRRFYFDTIIHSREAAAFLIESVGVERVMFGTDFPFDMNATSPVQDLEGLPTLDTSGRAWVFSETATGFLEPRRGGRHTCAL